MQCVWETLEVQAGRRKRRQAWSPILFHLNFRALLAILFLQEHIDSCRSQIEICQRQCQISFHYFISLFPLQSLQLSAKASVAKDMTG